jgi:hypothetical protein
MEGGIYLTIKDLMQLTGSDSYKSTAKSHKTIRDCLASDKRKLTIKEYCDYEGLNFSEILSYIRKTSSPKKA